MLNTVLSSCDIFTLSLSLSSSVFSVFHIKVFRHWETGILCSRKQRCGSDHPCYLFSNSTLSFLRWMDQILKIQVNYVFTRLRRFSVLFSVHLLVVPNFAFDLWTATEYAQGKPHNQYVVAPDTRL